MPVDAGRSGGLFARPPYIPAATDHLLFQDGDLDGENVTERIISRLAKHLELGGRFCGWALLLDRQTATAERRVHMMLGPEQHEFDAFLFVCRDWEYREFLKSFAAAVPKSARICRPEDPDHRLRPASAAAWCGTTLRLTFASPI